MVKKEKINDKTYYQCEICKFYYESNEFAEKCQEWCNKEHICNMEVTKHSVNPRGENKEDDS